MVMPDLKWKQILEAFQGRKKISVNLWSLRVFLGVEISSQLRRTNFSGNNGGSSEVSF